MLQWTSKVSTSAEQFLLHLVDEYDWHSSHPTDSKEPMDTYALLELVAALEAVQDQRLELAEGLELDLELEQAEELAPDLVLALQLAVRLVDELALEELLEQLADEQAFHVARATVAVEGELAVEQDHTAASVEETEEH